jgi:hypothetical protein
LNTPEDKLKLARGGVFERILTELDKQELAIIETHASFLWKDFFIQGFDPKYIDEMNPDVYVTIIDPASEIKKRLDSNEQWANQRLSIKDILYWQNIEVKDTKLLADLYGKPWYAIPSRQPASTLYKLLFHRDEIEFVYFSHLMKEATPKIKRMNYEFFRELEEYFTVIDPANFEMVVENSELKKYRDVIGHHIVRSEIEWLIKPVDRGVAYLAKNVPSSGVNEEIGRLSDLNKDVWLIKSTRKFDPYLEYHPDKIFNSRREFFEFLNEQGYVPLRERFPEEFG